MRYLFVSSNKQTSIIYLILFLFLSNISFAAKPPLRTINCNTVTAILNAMAAALPGDEIVIAPGTYIATTKVTTPDKIAARFFSDKDGTAANPIIIKGQDPKNLPVLKGPDGIYDGYSMRILGNYWTIKDLILEDGSKGLVMDNSNFSNIINVTVRDIAQEAIHIRDGSSNTLIDKCNIYNVGVNDPGNGEGIYVGTDRKAQSTTPGVVGGFNRNCDNTTIQNCIIGPDVRAEGIDVKEGTENTVIKNCTFSAKGISGLTSADAFIDLKGIYCYVYDNTFNQEGSAILASGIDFQDRTEAGQTLIGEKTGYRQAIFNNTFNFDSRIDVIQTVRSQGGDPKEIHFWNNKRVPASPDLLSNYTKQGMVFSCTSSWKPEFCTTLDIEEYTVSNLNCYPIPARDILYINGVNEYPVAVEIVNSNGQLVSSKIIQNASENLNLGQISSGMYILKIKEKQNVIFKKLIKQ
jgi:endoglucanase